MSEKKFRFFCPTRKIDTDAQTAICGYDHYKTGTVSKKMAYEDMSTVLFQQSRPQSSYRKALINGYNSRLGFYLTTLCHEDFDILTPPPSLFTKQQASVIFRFYDKYFSISSTDTSPKCPTIEFTYKTDITPILETIETGEITRDLARILEKLKITGYEEGVIIGLIEDYRFAPEGQIHYIKLSIGPDLFLYYTQNPAITPEQRLEMEKKVLLLQNPIVCTDPSPDFARMQSVYDTRKKMWMDHFIRTEEDIIPAEEPKRQAAPKQIPRIEQLRCKVELPDVLQQLCANISKRNPV